MGIVTSDRTAFEEAVVFLSHFRDLDDPRQRGKGLTCSRDFGPPIT
jgi:hypothetical protein